MRIRKSKFIAALAIIGFVLSACVTKDRAESQQRLFTAAESTAAVRTMFDTLRAHPRLMIDTAGRRTPYYPNWVVKEFNRDSAGFLISLVVAQGQLDGPLRVRVTNAGAVYEP
jgi:hypothetical protein